MTHDIVPMFVAMFFAGALSTMNIWANSTSDIRFSLNDLYMILLMTGWMFLFLGIYYRINNQIILGLVLVVLSLFAIRTQFLIGQNQYIKGMIPHHSMAVFMSRKLLEKNVNPTIKMFAQNVIDAQKEEIDWLKSQQ